MDKVGVILNNIGSPLTYSEKDVADYLKEFLMDKDVINIPFIIRWLLVHLIIVPKRKKISSENYKKIWTNDGSPLIANTQKLATALQSELGNHFLVSVGMRYSKPNIEESIKSLMSQNINKIIFIPLFPQYAEATTGSAIKQFNKILKKFHFKGQTQIVESFYDHPDFIKALAQSISQFRKPQTQLLLSYHGLPESHIKKISGCLQNENCCDNFAQQKKNCYKAQCYATTRLLENELNESHILTSFQSRLGKTEWIKPYTDSTLRELGQQQQSIQTSCPAFVTDCIETLEEIKVEGKKTFIDSGGNSFEYLHCLNDQKDWVKALAKITLQYSHFFDI